MGIFAVPERTVRLLPSDLDGKAVLELGCGTAYVSAWLARRGATPIGVDPSAGQLGIARRCQDEFGLAFPLVRASGEQVPLADGSFDLVISEMKWPSGPIRTGGSPRPPGCCARGAS